MYLIVGWAERKDWSLRREEGGEEVTLGVSDMVAEVLGGCVGDFTLKRVGEEGWGGEFFFLMTVERIPDATSAMRPLGRDRSYFPRKYKFDLSARIVPKVSYKRPT